MTWEVRLTVPNQIGSMQGKEKKNPPMYKFDAMTLWQGTNGENGFAAAQSQLVSIHNESACIHPHI